MSQYSVSQIDAQTKTFQDAYRRGEISVTQYRHAMNVQSQNRAEALKREQQTASQPKPVTQIQALTTVAANTSDRTEIAKAKEVFYPQDKQVTNITYQQATGEFTAEYQQPQQPTPKQSDYGLGVQLLAASKVFGDVVSSKFGKDSPAALEVKYGVQPLISFNAGMITSLEAEAYGTASLAKSVYSSAQQGKLVYTPVKTPLLGPTVTGSLVNRAFGDSREMEAMEKMPFGYSYGAAFGEVGMMLIGGKVAGSVAGKTASVFKTVINPKVNVVAESALARSKIAAETGLNKLSSGLGSSARASYSGAGYAVSGKLDSAAVRLGKVASRRVVDPLKMKIADPLISTGTRAKREVVTVGQRASDLAVPKGNSETAMFARVVAKPNLTEYGRVTKLKMPEVNIGLPQGAKNVKGFGKQVLVSERLTPKTVKPYIKNPIKNVSAEIKGTLTAQPIRKTSDKILKAPKGQIVKLGFEGETQFIPKSDTMQFSKLTKQFNKQLKAQRAENLLKQKSTNAKALTVQIQKPAQATKSLQRISGAPNITKPYPGSRQRQTEEYDLEIVSMPKTGKTRLIPTITAIQNQPSLIRNGGPMLSNTRNISTQSFDVQLKPSQTSILSPRTSTSTSVIEKQTPKFTQIQTIKPMNPTPNIKVPKMPSFSLGGGSGGFGGGGGFSGKMFKQNNPVKTPKQMLKDFGSFGGKGNGLIRQPRQVKGKRRKR